LFLKIPAFKKNNARQANFIAFQAPYLSSLCGRRGDRSHPLGFEPRSFYFQKAQVLSGFFSLKAGFYGEKKE